MVRMILAGALAAGAVFGTTAATAGCDVNIGRCSSGYCDVNIGTCAGGNCTVTVGRCDDGETALVAL